MRVVRFLAGTSATSLTDQDEPAWRQHSRTAFNDTRSRSFLGYAYRTVADLAEAGGWEAEYRRDVWQLRRLGFDGDRTLRFDRIGQPWLKDPARATWQPLEVPTVTLLPRCRRHGRGP